MNIMVCYNGSKESYEALMLASEHAKTFNAKIDVVTSLKKGNENNYQDIKDAEHELEYTHTLLEEFTIPSETHLLIRGLSPGEDLIQFAKENNVDEIFIGVRRRSRVGKFILLSTSHYVILEASCPVITVK